MAIENVKMTDKKAIYGFPIYYKKICVETKSYLRKVKLFPLKRESHFWIHSYLPRSILSHIFSKAWQDLDMRNKCREMSCPLSAQSLPCRLWNSSLLLAARLQIVTDLPNKYPFFQNFHYAISAQIYGNCGGDYAGIYGTIASPGFPLANYPKNSACKWTVEVPKGMIVEVSVQI